MVLVLVVPTYDAEADELRLAFAQAPVMSEVSYVFGVSATYSADDELLTLTLRSARANASQILAQALELTVRRVPPALVATVAVLLQYFDAVPDLSALPSAARNRAGYLVEDISTRLLEPPAAARIVRVLAAHRPGKGTDLEAAWRLWELYDGLTHRPTLDLLRTQAFHERMGAVLRSDKVADLMAEMPEGLPRVDGWDDMPSVGRERTDGKF